MRESSLKMMIISRSNIPFMDVKSEPQRGDGMCLRPLGEVRAELRVELPSPMFQVDVPLKVALLRTT